jgi:hypothetical protein
MICYIQIHIGNESRVKHLRNLSRNSKFVENRTKISGTFHEDLNRFRCCVRHKSTTKSFLYNTQYLYIVDSDT